MRRGADVADVGCGRGRALIRLAQAYPAGRYVGYDLHEDSIAAARANAETAGVTDRVGFECRDASKGIPSDYDVITTFDVIHDAADPRGILRAIRAALRSGRTVRVPGHQREPPAGGQHWAARRVFLRHQRALLSDHLAGAWRGLGTCGFNEHTARQLCAEAGFGAVRRVEMENPFNILYEITI